MTERPTHIGKYEIVGVAGEGAMGVVYIGHDPFVDRKVAIKVSTRDQRGNEENEVAARAARKMFFNEAQSAGALDHPNILKVYDAGDADGQPYIVMEYVEQADTLRSFCRPDNLLPVETAVHLMKQCAEALDYAHEHGITHRDIKPANIMLTRDGQVKLGDFGIAQRTQTDQTQVLGWFGSPLYMSPEQANDEVLTPQSDIFSLGVVMYELLTGKQPFAAKGIHGLINNVLNKDPEPVTVLRPELPEHLAAVVGQCLEKERGKRYRTAAEVAAELRSVLDEIENPQLQLTEEQKFRLARELVFFRDFSDSELSEVLNAAEWQSYVPGTEVVSEGERGSAFYVIVHGQVAVRRAGREIASLGKGQCFGEMAYLSGSPRSATIASTEALSLIKIEEPAVEWASVSCQMRLNKAFQRILIERLDSSSRLLARQDR